MLVFIVNVHIKPEYVEDFIAATKVNAECSLREAGVARFDFLQEESDKTRFVLYEGYYDASGPELHRETNHYKNWKAAVENMMQEPRTKTNFANLFPRDEEWK